MTTIRKKTISYLLIFFIIMSSLGLNTNIADAAVKFGNSIKTGFVWGDDYQINILKVNNKHAYCLEPDKMITDVNSYTEKKHNFTNEQWSTLVKIAHFGYNNKKKTREDYAAAQVAMWREIMKWENKKSPSLKKSNIKGLEKKVLAIETAVKNYDKMIGTKPSFNGKKNIKFNSGSKGTIKDTNGVLGKYPYKITNKPEGVKVSIDKKNNALNIDASSSKAKSGKIELTIERDNNIKKNRFYYSSKSQNVATIGYVANLKVAVSIDVEDVGTLKILKTSQTGKNIEGVVFKFKDTKTGKEYTATTDKEGVISETIPVGNYDVQEVSVPKPYIVDKTPQKVTIAKNKVTTVNFENDTPKGRVVLQKANGNGDALAGAQYRFWADSVDGEGNENKFDKVFTTDEKGQITIENLPLGTYKYQEIKAPNLYIRDNNIYSFEIEYKGQTTPLISITKQHVNNKAVGKITLTKYSKDGKEKLAGAKFRIWSQKNNGYDKTFTTDKNGKIEVDNLELGDYYCQEISAPYGYVLDNTKYEFSIKYKDDQTKLITVAKEFKNEKAVGKFKLVKKNEKDIPLKDAEYRIWSEGDKNHKEGEILDKVFKTDDNGNIIVEGLQLGKYCYQEVKAPYGYVRDETVYKFEVKYKDDKTPVVEVLANAKNSLAKGRFELVKFNKDKSMKLEGAKYRIWSQADENNKEGKLYDETFTTDKNEKIVIDNLELGKYYYQEIKAPYGYVVDEKKYEFELQYKNDLTAVVTVSKEATNKLVVGSFELIKFEDAGIVPLEDAEYRIWSKGDKEHKDGEIFDKTLKTDNQGRILVENLPLGKYCYQEIKAPFGYVKDDLVYEFELKYKDDKTSVVKHSVTALNEEALGQFELIKYNKDKSETLAGAKYHIWSAADDFFEEGVLLDEVLETDEDGTIWVDELYFGKYYYQEIKAPHGYVRDDKIYEFEVSYIDDETPIIEVYAEATNDLAKGELELIKLNQNKSQNLQGAKYHIWSKDKKFDKTFVTDKDGKITVKDLEFGTYYYQEIEAPDGYLLDETVGEVDIKYEDDMTPVVKVSRSVTDKEPVGEIGLIKTFAKQKNITDEDIKKASLEGAVYEAYAKEEITNKAGTKTYYKKGEKVGIFTTDEKGITNRLQNLPLGTYSIKEVKAPKGCALDNTVYDVELGYKDQHTANISKTLDVEDEIIPTPNIKTSDDAPIGAIVLLMLMGLSGSLALAIRRKN